MIRECHSWVLRACIKTSGLISSSIKNTVYVTILKIKKKSNIISSLFPSLHSFLPFILTNKNKIWTVYLDESETVFSLFKCEGKKEI